MLQCNNRAAAGQAPHWGESLRGSTYRWVYDMRRAGTTSGQPEALPSAKAAEQDADIDEEGPSPDCAASGRHVAHVHQDVEDSQHDEQEGQHIQQGLPCTELVGNDHRPDKERQRLETIGLRSIGARSPICLAGQPGARVMIVEATILAGWAQVATLGKQRTGQGQQHRNENTPVRHSETSHMHACHDF